MRNVDNRLYTCNWQEQPVTGNCKHRTFPSLYTGSVHPVYGTASSCSPRKQQLYSNTHSPTPLKALIVRRAGARRSIYRMYAAQERYTHCLKKDVRSCRIDINYHSLPYPVSNPHKPVDNLLVHLLITIDLSTGQQGDRHGCG